MEIRKFVTSCEEIQAELGEPTGRIVRKAVCSAVIDNPLVGKRHKDLTMLELMGAEISGILAEKALRALGVEASEVTAYGKGAIVGTAGEIEHAAALIHPRFGAPVRKVVIKGDDIIPSTKRLLAPVHQSPFQSPTRMTFGHSMKWTQSKCALVMHQWPTKLLSALHLQ